MIAHCQEKRLLASASDDGTIKIWELASLCMGKQVLLCFKTVPFVDLPWKCFKPNSPVVLISFLVPNISENGH